MQISIVNYYDLFDIEYHQISELISLVFDYSFIRNITITFIWFYFIATKKSIVQFYG